MTINTQKFRTSMFAAAALTVLGAATMVAQPASAACVAGKNTDPNSTIPCAGAANQVKDGTNILAPGETAPISTTGATGTVDPDGKLPGQPDEADAGVVQEGTEGTSPAEIISRIVNQDGSNVAPSDPGEATSPAPGLTDEPDNGIVESQIVK